MALNQREQQLYIQNQSIMFPLTQMQQQQVMTPQRMMQQQQQIMGISSPTAGNLYPQENKDGVLYAQPLSPSITYPGGSRSSPMRGNQVQLDNGKVVEMTGYSPRSALV